MDLKVFHDTVRYFLNKEQGGWFPPEEIDNAADLAQMWYYGEQVQHYGKTQKDKDPLAPFVVKQSFTTPSTGILTLPTTYETLPSPYCQYYDSAHSRMRYKAIKLLSEDQIAERLDSQILQPTTSDPVGIETEKGTIQLYPETAIAGYCYYLRRPNKPTFVYTMVGRAVTYNQSTSVQLEWTGRAIIKVLIKTIQMLGVNVSDELIIQYTELKNKEDI